MRLLLQPRAKQALDRERTLRTLGEQSWPLGPCRGGGWGLRGARQGPWLRAAPALGCTGPETRAACSHSPGPRPHCGPPHQASQETLAVLGQWCPPQHPTPSSSEAGPDSGRRSECTPARDTKAAASALPPPAHPPEGGRLPSRGLPALTMAGMDATLTRPWGSRPAD